LTEEVMNDIIKIEIENKTSTFMKWGVVHEENLKESMAENHPCGGDYCGADFRRGVLRTDMGHRDDLPVSGCQTVQLQ
jgi:hypothetical protein